MPKLVSEIDRSPVTAYLTAIAGILLVALAFHPYHQHLRTTPGLFFILVIVLVASRWGRIPALFASVAAVVALNYFFIPPFDSVHTQELRYILMTAAFAITALTVGQLHAHAQQRARDAEQSKTEIEGLYRELQASFDQAAQAEAVRRTAEHLALAESVANTGSFDLHPPGCARNGPSAPDFWSDSLYRVLGIDPHVRPSYENWLAAVHPDDRDHIREELEKFTGSQEEYSQVDYRTCAPKEHVRWINTRCHMKRNRAGAAVRLIGAAIDVTERQRAADAIRSSEQFKSVLLDCLTHDLGTPLTSIKLESASLLRDQQLEVAMNGSQRESLRAIDEQASRLHQFIGNLASMARIQAGELHLRRSEVAVSDVIAKARRRLRPLCSPSRIQWSVARGLPSVEVDEQAVEQVFHTIVENACKYGSAHTPIGITVEHPGNREVFFAIENSGPEIPPELRERVFDRFYRIQEAAHVRKSRSSLASGNGMGLAIARGMILANNGRIWIESAKSGRGTRVVFTLPVCSCGQKESDFSI